MTTLTLIDHTHSEESPEVRRIECTSARVALRLAHGFVRGHYWRIAHFTYHRETGPRGHCLISRPGGTGDVRISC